MRDIRDEHRPRVLQVLPADGWSAVWADDDGKPWSDRLVCWALVAFVEHKDAPGDFWPAVSGSRQAVVGMTTGLDGWVDNPEGGDNFLGYSALGESLDCWNEQAASYAERKKQRESTP